MNKKEKRNNVKNKVMNILSGSVLTEDFFVKNTLFIAVIVLLMVVYISNRYTYIEQMSRIKKMNKELKDSKYEYQTISSELMGMSRQSRVFKIVQDDQLGLEVSSKPVYEIGGAKNGADKK